MFFKSGDFKVSLGDIKVILKILKTDLKGKFETFKSIFIFFKSGDLKVRLKIIKTDTIQILRL